MRGESKMIRRVVKAVSGLALAFGVTACAHDLRGTGDMGLVIERATGSILVVDHSASKPLGRVEGWAI